MCDTKLTVLNVTKQFKNIIQLLFTLAMRMMWDLQYKQIAHIFAKQPLIQKIKAHPFLQLLKFEK